MNSKLIKASLAGVAAIAVTAGGTTFAAWSDFGTQDAEIGAGYLKLDIVNTLSIDQTAMSLAPGQNQDIDFLLATADSGNTPNGKLTLKVTDLIDTEDGPSGGCTTASEAAAIVDGGEGATGGDCGSGPGSGELSDEVKLSVKTGAPGIGGVCDNSVTFVELTPPLPAVGGGNTPFLGSVAAGGSTWTLDSVVTPGEDICVRVRAFLLSSATNAIQGDDATFTWQFDLTQL